MSEYETDVRQLVATTTVIQTAVTKIGVKIAIASALTTIVISTVASLVILWANHHL